MSNSVLYALVMFAVAGTVAQWFNIWHILNRLDKLEREHRSAELPQQIPAGHAQDAANDPGPEI
jgi:hypothetical protein